MGSAHFGDLRWRHMRVCNQSVKTLQRLPHGGNRFRRISSLPEDFTARLLGKGKRTNGFAISGTRRCQRFSDSESFVEADERSRGIAQILIVTIALNVPQSRVRVD